MNFEREWRPQMSFREYSFFVNDFGFQEAVCKISTLLVHWKRTLFLCLQIVLQGVLDDIFIPEWSLDDFEHQE